jgi:hypothetical protein
MDLPSNHKKHQHPRRKGLLRPEKHSPGTKAVPPHLMGAPKAPPSHPDGDDPTSVVPSAPATTVPAATTTATTATAAATTVPATAATTTVRTSPASTTKVAPRWTRLVDGQPAALQRLTVEARDGPFHIFVLIQFDKSEAPRLTRHLIAYDHG